MDHGGHIIHAAGAAAVFQRYGGDETVDGAGGHRRQQRAFAVGGMIDETVQIDDVILVQKQQYRKHHHVGGGLHGKVLVHPVEADQRQGDVFNQRKIAHAEIEQVLHHGIDTGQAGGRELVWQNKNVIVGCHQRGGQSNDHVILEMGPMLEQQHIGRTSPCIIGKAIYYNTIKGFMLHKLCGIMLLRCGL